MKYIVTESQVKILQDQIQGLIDSTLDSIRKESEEWGMGEMDELDEVSSVDKIVVNYVDKTVSIMVSVTVHKNSKREDFDNLITEIEARMEDWIPNIELYIEDIVDNRKFGPGIDW
jgi:divalent metal cation (Fe/Co/Zn/Cd) transporter